MVKKKNKNEVTLFSIDFIVFLQFFLSKCIPNLKALKYQKYLIGNIELFKKKKAV